MGSCFVWKQKIEAYQKYKLCSMCLMYLLAYVLTNKYICFRQVTLIKPLQSGQGAHDLLCIFYILLNVDHILSSNYSGLSSL